MLALAVVPRVRDDDAANVRCRRCLQAKPPGIWSTCKPRKTETHRATKVPDIYSNFAGEGNWGTEKCEIERGRGPGPDSPRTRPGDLIGWGRCRPHRVRPCKYARSFVSFLHGGFHSTSTTRINYREHRASSAHTRGYQVHLILEFQAGKMGRRRDTLLVLALVSVKGQTKARTCLGRHINSTPSNVQLVATCIRMIAAARPPIAHGSHADGTAGQRDGCQDRRTLPSNPSSTQIF